MTNSDVRAVTLAECPIGLFVCGDELCLKTEYGNNEGRIDAYIVSSGEFFWGHQPQSISNQRQTLVSPVDATSVHLSPPAMDRDALRQVGRKLMAIEGTVPIAKEAQAIIMAALAGTGGGVPEGGTAQEPAVARDGRCTNCDCDFCRRHWQTKSNLAAVARDPKSRCWSCSCGWVGCYTVSDIAEYGEPSECNDCHRERLVECEQTALKQPSPTPTSPDKSRSAEGEDEPTLEMIEAGYDATRLPDGTPQFADAGFCIGHAAQIYKAMRAALRTHRGGEK